MIYLQLMDVFKNKNQQNQQNQQKPWLMNVNDGYIHKLGHPK